MAVCCFTLLGLVIIHMTRVDIKSLSRTVLHPVSRDVFGINSVIQTLKRGQVGISQVPTAMDGRQIRKRSRRPSSLANSFGITYLGKGYGCVKQERAKAAEGTQTLLFVFPFIHSNNRFIAGAEALVLNPTASSNYSWHSSMAHKAARFSLREKNLNLSSLHPQEAIHHRLLLQNWLRYTVFMALCFPCRWPTKGKHIQIYSFFVIFKDLHGRISHKNTYRGYLVVKLKPCLGLGFDHLIPIMSKSTHEWPRVTTSDHESPRMTTSDHESPRMTTSKKAKKLIIKLINQETTLWYWRLSTQVNQVNGMKKKNQHFMKNYTL